MPPTSTLTIMDQKPIYLSNISDDENKDHSFPPAQVVQPWRPITKQPTEELTEQDVTGLPQPEHSQATTSSLHDTEAQAAAGWTPEYKNPAAPPESLTWRGAFIGLLCTVLGLFLLASFAFGICVLVRFLYSGWVYLWEKIFHD